MFTQQDRPVQSILNRQNLVYKVPGTRWDEALPMGDGCFGAMVYEEKGAFTWTINHLDVYMAFNTKNFPMPSKWAVNGYTYREIVRRAVEAHRNPNSPAAQCYGPILSPWSYNTYGWLREGAWMNVAGQLKIRPTHLPEDAVWFEQVLDLYNAAVITRCRWKDGTLLLRSFVARHHRTLVVEVEMSKPGLIERLELSRFPVAPGAATSSGATGGDFWLSDVLRPPNVVWGIETGADPVGYALYGRILDEHALEWEAADIRRTACAVEIPIPRKLRRFSLLLTVALDKPGVSQVDAARQIISDAHRTGTSKMVLSHRQYWHGFWGKSQIELADRFIEKLWYLNLYALACCDGTGMRVKSQAAGLNGLWDVKNSSAWGSSWYWDINIQQIYWGCYTANHLEMTKPFYDGLREYLPAARLWAKEFYGMRGLAGDYPFPFYHCIWPWCCQFLWWGYRYSMDANFLRETAYPIMREVLQFFEDFLRRDAQGRYYVFPTISPEQGPLGKNTAILLACLRYLLKAGIEASRCLNEDEKKRCVWQKILANLSDLPVGRSIEYGETFLDSEWASPTLHLGHPSVLMAIYPTGLLGVDSPARLLQIARNTLKYVENREAISTHNFGWLAAAAACLGMGDEALRILYETGVAHAVRTNGLIAEETDRWIDNCAVLSGTVYMPAMPEGSGALLGAVNEMLIQSRAGKVRIFPAIPSSWSYARFNKLLAEGAWEVSAEFYRGKTRWVEIAARVGGTCHLVVNGRKITVRLDAGEKRRIRFGGRLPKGAERAGRAIQPVRYVTPTDHRLFLGKTAETEYLRKLDAFLYEYQLGDNVVLRATKYKFDFGTAAKVPKDYASVIPQQFFNRARLKENGKRGPDFYRIHPGTLYTPLSRLGWKSSRGLKAADRRGPDALRRDFVYGARPAAFCVELPRGHYQLLCLIGDAAAETHMRIEVPDQFRWQTRRPLRAGEFDVQTFDFRVVEDGPAEIHLAGIQRHPWILNVLMINRMP